MINYRWPPTPRVINQSAVTFCDDDDHADHADEEEEEEEEVKDDDDSSVGNDEDEDEAEDGHPTISCFSASHRQSTSMDDGDDGDGDDQAERIVRMRSSTLKTVAKFEGDMKDAIKAELDAFDDVMDIFKQASGDDGSIIGFLLTMMGVDQLQTHGTDDAAPTDPSSPEAPTVESPSSSTSFVEEGDKFLRRLFF